MNGRRARATEVAIRDGDALDRAIVAARRRVLRLHRLMGVPVVIWRDGAVVEVAPESVEIPADLDSREFPGVER